MKIDFSEQEYRVLLDMVYLADWMVNSSRVPDERMTEFDDLKAKVYSFAEAFGFTELVDYNSSTKRFEESKQLEDELDSKGYISDYDDMTFWEELTSCLGDKYLLELYGEDSLRNLSREELFLKRLGMEEQVSDVIDRDGIQNLTLTGFIPNTDAL